MNKKTKKKKRKNPQKHRSNGKIGSLATWTNTEKATSVVSATKDCAVWNP